jgi:hypothetical protein
VLVYKKMHRPLKFKLIDGSVKTVLVDESQPVINIVTAIAERLNIQNPEEYSLARDVSEGDPWYVSVAVFFVAFMNIWFDFHDIHPILC